MLLPPPFSHTREEFKAWTDAEKTEKIIRFVTEGLEGEVSRFLISNSTVLRSLFLFSSLYSVSSFCFNSLFAVITHTHIHTIHLYLLGNQSNRPTSRAEERYFDRECSGLEEVQAFSYYLLYLSGKLISYYAGERIIQYIALLWEHLQNSAILGNSTVHMFYWPMYVLHIQSVFISYTWYIYSHLPAHTVREPIYVQYSNQW